jgi:hypothetical protein
MAKPAWRIIAIVTILIGCPPSILAQRTVGYVLEMQGEWTIGGSATGLSMGQPVKEGVVLANPNPAAGDHIVVANLQGEIIRIIRCRSGVCRECRESGACYDPIQPLPITTDSTSTISTAFKAIAELFVGKPDRYSVHRVRGSGFAIARNGIVRMDGSTVDVNDFFRDQGQGSYEVQFVPLSGETSGANDLKSKPNQLIRSPEGKTVLAVEGLHAGLYEMRVTRGDMTSSASVLVCDAVSYPNTAASFQAFVQKTDSWGTSVSEATRQTYQRAFLEYLASLSRGPVQ